ncbi:MAG: hypothetical protein ACYCWW_14755 [Deltaproteobacteria bacterium]
MRPIALGCLMAIASACATLTPEERGRRSLESCLSGCSDEAQQMAFADAASFNDMSATRERQARECRADCHRAAEHA